MAFNTPITNTRAGRLSLLHDAVTTLGLLLVVWAGLLGPHMFFQTGRSVPRGLPFERVIVIPPIAFIVVAMCVLPLVLRRRFPVGVLVATTAGFVLYEALHLPPSLIILAVLVAFYTAGTLLDRRKFAMWGIACGMVVLSASVPAWGTTMFWADLVRTAALLLVAAAAGDATRNRRAYIEEVVRRAAEEARMREEESRRRIDEERLRIARELHDVTAHSLSIVAVQSGVALHVLDSDPAAARAALTAIRETSRTSLQELRGMLGVLRSSTDEGEDVPLAPTPGLARIGDLVRPLRDAGLRVEVAALPPGGPLSAIVDASAYRIIQEALTNVLRHAGDASVSVHLTRDDYALSLEVIDDGAGEPFDEPGEGHGIAGMRERALALGGTFEAGPVTGGGWRVAAVLPLTTRSA